MKNTDQSTQEGSPINSPLLAASDNERGASDIPPLVQHVATTQIDPLPQASLILPLQSIKIREESEANVDGDKTIRSAIKLLNKKEDLFQASFTNIDSIGKTLNSISHNSIQIGTALLDELLANLTPAFINLNQKVTTEYLKPLCNLYTQFFHIFQQQKYQKGTKELLSCLENFGQRHIGEIQEDIFFIGDDYSKQAELYEAQVRFLIHLGNFFREQWNQTGKIENLDKALRCYTYGMHTVHKYHLTSGQDQELIKLIVLSEASFFFQQVAGFPKSGFILNFSNIATEEDKINKANFLNLLGDLLIDCGEKVKAKKCYLSSQELLSSHGIIDSRAPKIAGEALLRLSSLDEYDGSLNSTPKYIDHYKEQFTNNVSRLNVIRTTTKKKLKTNEFNIHEYITPSLFQVIEGIAESCIKYLGPAPCDFAMMNLNPISGPFSGVRLALLIDRPTSIRREWIEEYFNQFIQLLSIRILSLGESYHNRIFPVTKGFCVHDSIIKGDIRELLEFLKGKLSASALFTADYVCGSNKGRSLFSEYTYAVGEMLTDKASLNETIHQKIGNDLLTRFLVESKAFTNVYQNINVCDLVSTLYQFIDGLSLYYNTYTLDTSYYSKITKLLDKSHIDSKTAAALVTMLEFANNLLYHAQFFKGENFPLASIIEDPSIYSIKDPERGLLIHFCGLINTLRSQTENFKKSIEEKSSSSLWRSGSVLVDWLEKEDLSDFAEHFHHIASLLKGRLLYGPTLNHAILANKLLPENSEFERLHEQARLALLEERKILNIVKEKIYSVFKLLHGEAAAQIKLFEEEVKARELSEVDEEVNLINNHQLMYLFRTLISLTNNLYPSQAEEILRATYIDIYQPFYRSTFIQAISIFIESNRKDSILQIISHYPQINGYREEVTKRRNAFSEKVKLNSAVGRIIESEAASFEGDTCTVIAGPSVKETFALIRLVERIVGTGVIPTTVLYKGEHEDAKPILVFEGGSATPQRKNPQRWKNKGQDLNIILSKLSEENFTKLYLISLLISLSNFSTVDSSFDLQIEEEHLGECKFLFVPMPISAESYSPPLVDIIFCLANKVFSKRVVQEFLALDPAEILKAWIDEVKQENLISGISVARLEVFYKRFAELQYLFEQNQNITPPELFRLSDFHVWKQYSFLHLQNEGVWTRYGRIKGTVEQIVSSPLKFKNISSSPFHQLETLDIRHITTQGPNKSLPDAQEKIGEMLSVQRNIAVSKRDLVRNQNTTLFKSLPPTTRAKLLNEANIYLIMDDVEWTHLRRVKGINFQNISEQTQNLILDAIIQTLSPEMDTLSLINCTVLNLTKLVTILRALPKLISLDISGCDKLGNEALPAIASLCRNLVYLKMSNLPRLTEINGRNGATLNFPHLEELSAANNVQLTNINISTSVLHFIDLSGCAHLSFNELCRVARPTLREMVKLDETQLKRGERDTLFQIITESEIAINDARTNLELGKSEPFRTLVAKVGGIIVEDVYKKINFSRLQSNRQLFILDELKFVLSTYNLNVKVLKIIGCSAFTVQWFQSVKPFLNSLNNLNLNGCTLSNEIIKVIATLPNLETFKIAYVKGVSEISASTIIRSASLVFTKLKKLVANSNNELIHLLVNAPNLVEVDFSFCPQLKYEELRLFTSPNCTPQLETIKLNGYQTKDAKNYSDALNTETDISATDVSYSSFSDEDEDEIFFLNSQDERQVMPLVKLQPLHQDKVEKISLEEINDDPPLLTTELVINREDSIISEATNQQQKETLALECATQLTLPRLNKLKEKIRNELKQLNPEPFAALRSNDHKGFVISGTDEQDHGIKFGKLKEEQQLFLFKLIRELPILERLNLANCKALDASWLKSFAFLSHLTYLNLNGCEKLDDVSFVISRCTKLQIFVATNLPSVTSLYGSFFGSFSHSSLEVLNISNSSLESIKILAPKLVQLSATGYKGESQGLVALISSSLVLRQVDISKCINIGDKFSQLASYVATQTCLTDLNLREVGIVNMRSLPQALRTAKLRKLDLSNNRVQDEEKEIIPLAEALSTNTTLEVLILNFNSISQLSSSKNKGGISSIGAEALANMLKFNKTLKTLHIASCCLDSKLTEQDSRLSGYQITTRSLAFALLFNTTLTDLDLSNNNLPNNLVQLLNEEVKINIECQKLQLPQQMVENIDPHIRERAVLKMQLNSIFDESAKSLQSEIILRSWVSFSSCKGDNITSTWKKLINLEIKGTLEFIITYLLENDLCKPLNLNQPVTRELLRTLSSTYDFPKDTSILAKLYKHMHSIFEKIMTDMHQLIVKAWVEPDFSRQLDFDAFVQSYSEKRQTRLKDEISISVASGSPELESKIRQIYNTIYEHIIHNEIAELYR